MSHSRRVACVVLCLGVGLASGCAQQSAQSAGRIWEVGQSEPDAALSAAVEAKLNGTGVKFEFSGIAFSDVVQYLRDASDCSIYVNWNALQAVGIEKNTPVNVRLGGVTMRTGLRTVLNDVGGVNPLAFDVRSGVLVITTGDNLSRHTVVRVYDVSDLIRPRAVTGREEAELPTDPLVGVIFTAVAPDSWEGTGGRIGSFRFLDTKMVVRQTPMAHRQIADLLAALREQTAPMSAAKPAPPPEAPPQA